MTTSTKTTPRYIWTAPGTFELLEQVAADPRRRANALANALKHKARRKYLALVEVFSEFDARDGVTPLIARAVDKAPPDRRQIRDVVPGKDGMPRQVTKVIDVDKEFGQ